MIKCDVLFEKRTEFLNIIYTRFDFKGLTDYLIYKAHRIISSEW
jgi:hypothetical protein